jgi:hypothetical protein
MLNIHEYRSGDLGRRHLRSPNTSFMAGTEECVVLAVALSGMKSHILFFIVFLLKT